MVRSVAQDGTREWQTKEWSRLLGHFLGEEEEVWWVGDDNREMVGVSSNLSLFLDTWVIEDLTNSRDSCEKNAM